MKGKKRNNYNEGNICILLRHDNTAEDDNQQTAMPSTVEHLTKTETLSHLHDSVGKSEKRGKRKRV